MVDALTSDCRVLLARFEERHSVRFEDFCEEWKKLNFSLINYAREREWEKLQVTECLFRILNTYLSPTCPLQYQVGAIYALYSFYNTQRVVPKVKIRMTLSMWKDLLKLQEKTKLEKHYDVNYVIQSLRAAKAFIFVAMPVTLACGSRDAIPVHERDLEKESKHSNAVSNVLDTLKKIDQVDNTYKAMKIEISSSDGGEPLVDPVTLKVASNDFVSQLERDVNEFQTWKQKSTQNSIKSRHMTRTPELGLPKERGNNVDTNITNQSAPVETKQDLKTRSFKKQVSKNKRHQQLSASKKERPSKKRNRKR